MGSTHLSQDIWTLIQYCAEIGLIFKKHLANSQQASYSLFSLFTSPSYYVVIKNPSLHWNVSRSLRVPSLSKTLSRIFWLEKLNLGKVPQCSIMWVTFAGSPLWWCRQLGRLQPVLYTLKIFAYWMSNSSGRGMISPGIFRCKIWSTLSKNLLSSACSD